MPVHVEIEHPDQNAVWFAPKFLEEGSGQVKITGIGNSLHVNAPLIPGRPDIHLAGGARVIIGGDCNLGDVHLYAAQGAFIEIGPWTSFNGTSQIMAHEPARVTIGTGCLFGPDCVLAASDVHHVVDARTGVRLNPAGDIVVADHVWCGPRVAILRNARIGRDSVVGFGSVVTGSFPPNVLLAGAPARVAKENVSWRF